MLIKSLFLAAGVFMFSSPTPALEYQSAPDPIPRILSAPEKPWLIVSPSGDRLLSVQGGALPDISEVAITAVELAGLRLDPATNAPLRTWYADRAEIVSLENDSRIEFELPPTGRAYGFEWSPDGRHIAWILKEQGGIFLWLADAESGKSRRVCDRPLNPATAEAYTWMPDSKSLLCPVQAAGRGAVPAEAAPTGPVIEENLGGKAPARTFSNLLQSPQDEALFEYYLSCDLWQIPVEGKPRVIAENVLLQDYDVSPDNQWLLVESTHRPFSYSLPSYRFPLKSELINLESGEGRLVYDAPLAVDVPIAFGSVRTGPRRIAWRQDTPATLFWVEALDGGDASCDVSQRDRVMQQAAPFLEEAAELCRTKDRFAGIYWGDGERALLYESWYRDRRERVLRLNPSTGETELLHERQSDDAYTSPGRPITQSHPDGHWSLRFSEDGSSIFWKGRGASDAGIYPFLDQMDWATGEKTRIWQCRDPFYESVSRMLDSSGERLLINREANDQPENAYLLEKPTGEVPRSSEDYHLRRVTDHKDPAPELAGITQEVVRYTRADGVELSATIYLPPGYDPERDGSLPFLLWVYPREFKSRESAGRVTASENIFSRPSATSVLFLLLRGYGIMANPTLPILGEDSAEPNDSYLTQLEDGARAAVELLVSRGLGDADRMAIAGHSYGAFTAANLVAHTTLFRTAICRSGAYNRTLTPFGFQGEERNLWEAGETYLKMSPFMEAQRIQVPLLLIHGMEDPNSGTYPMQSERFFEALKGLGAEVRLVRLPGEGHGYRARQSVEHVLWEMIRWCDLHLAAREKE